MKNFMVEYALKGSSTPNMKMEVYAADAEEAKQYVRAKLQTPSRNTLNFISKVYECEDSTPEIMALLHDLFDSLHAGTPPQVTPGSKLYPDRFEGWDK